MSREVPRFERLDETEEMFPVCPYCGRPYGDGDIFDVKNYPDDGGAIMFLKHDSCEGKEAQLFFEWRQVAPSKPVSRGKR